MIPNAGFGNDLLLEQGFMMAVSIEELTEIDKLLAAEGSAPLPLSELRSRFPHLTWTKCDASDVIEPPYRSYPHYDVHLLDGADHCVQVTMEPARATGIVLAYRRIPS
jgi:hypothetical protein